MSVRIHDADPQPPVEAQSEPRHADLFEDGKRGDLHGGRSRPPRHRSARGRTRERSTGSGPWSRRRRARPAPACHGPRSRRAPASYRENGRPQLHPGAGHNGPVEPPGRRPRWGFRRARAGARLTPRARALPSRKRAGWRIMPRGLRKDGSRRNPALARAQIPGDRDLRFKEMDCRPDLWTRFRPTPCPRTALRSAASPVPGPCTTA